METATYEYHPFANAFPMMTDQEFAELVADIKAHGLEEMIMLYEGKILDGRNRYKALVELGFNPAGFLNEESPLIGDEEALAFVISKNLVRRHLTTSQRAMVAADLTTLKHGQRKSDTSNDVSQADAAKLTKTSLPTVQRAAKVKAASPELAAKVRAGDLTVSGALAQIEPDKRAAPATNGHSDPGTTTNRHDISEDRLASDQLDNRRRHNASTTPRDRSPLETNDNSQSGDDGDIAPPEQIAENISYIIKRIDENARAVGKILKASALDREAVARINTAIDGMIKKWRSIQSTLEKKE
jgi:ParB-like chromosome segregation protein Spo0J